MRCICADTELCKGERGCSEMCWARDGGMLKRLLEATLAEVNVANQD